MDEELKTKIKKVIHDSGNDLHLRVAARLQALGWRVEIGRYYTDPVTGKSREIDLIASKVVSITTGFMREETESLSVRFFIECKYLREPVVFWNQPKDRAKTESIIRKTGILSEIPEGFFGARQLSPGPIHHYLKADVVAKLVGKAGQYDPIYEAMSGCLHGMAALKNQDAAGYYSIDMPLIVIDSNSNTFVRDATTPDGFTPTKDIQLEIDYTFQSQSESHLIDIVAESDLQEFLEQVNKNDVAMAVQLVRNQIYDRSFNRENESE